MTVDANNGSSLEMIDGELESAITDKIALAERAWIDGEYVKAAEMFKKIAGACFDLGDFPLGNQLLDKAEAAQKKRAPGSEKIEKYLVELQLKVNDALGRAKNISRARDLLRQMLAVAEKAGDPEAIKAIKESIKKIVQ